MLSAAGVGALVAFPLRTAVASRHEPRSCARLAGFTLLELLSTIAIITVLVALLLPALGKGKARTQRVSCASQLRNVALAMNSFANDHDDRYPMAYLTGLEKETVPGLTEGASNVTFCLSARPFQLLSNELSVPKILVCPTDRRTAATALRNLQPQQISYALGLAARPGDALSLVATDRNLTNWAPNLPAPSPGARDVRLGWTAAQHSRAGNVLLGDGHVEFWKNFLLPASPAPGLPPAGGGGSGSGARTGPGAVVAPAAPAPTPTEQAPSGRSGSGTSGATGRQGSFDAAEQGARGAPSLVTGREQPTNIVPKVAETKPSALSAEPAEENTYGGVEKAIKGAYLLCLLWALLVLLGYYLRRRARRRRRPLPDIVIRR